MLLNAAAKKPYYLPLAITAVAVAYFVLAGLVIPEGRWTGMHDKLSGLKRSSGYHGVPLSSTNSKYITSVQVERE